MIDRAPRKYLDVDKVEVNPEWLTWRQAELDYAREIAPKVLAGTGYDPAMYFPELYDKDVPEDGAWILVLEEPFTELRSRFRVPLLSLWRCRPHTLNSGGVRIGTGRNQLVVRPKQAVITTPGGDLHLWPHEYSIVTDPYALMSCEGTEIHSLGGQSVLDEEKLFYLQSRGIPHSEAVLLLIEQVAATDFIYATFPEEITAQLEGVGQPLWRHIQRHPRISA